jgi:hypothetical protein
MRGVPEAGDSAGKGDILFDGDFIGVINKPNLRLFTFTM